MDGCGDRGRGVVFEDSEPWGPSTAMVVAEATAVPWPKKSHREPKSPSFGVVVSTLLVFLGVTQPGSLLISFNSSAGGVATWSSEWRDGAEESPAVYAGDRSRLITGVKSQLDVIDAGIDDDKAQKSKANAVNLKPWLR